MCVCVLRQAELFQLESCAHLANPVQVLAWSICLMQPHRIQALACPLLFWKSFFIVFVLFYAKFKFV